MRRWAPGRTLHATSRVVVVFAVAAAAWLPAASGAGAQTTSDQDKARRLFEQLDATDSQQQVARDQLASLQKQRQQLDRSLTSLASQVEAANARVAAATAEAARIGAIAADLAAQVDATTRQLDAAKSDLQRSALLLYTRGDGSASIAILRTLKAGGPAIEAQHYLQQLSQKRRQDAERVNKLRADLEEQQAQVVVQLKAAAEARDEATTQKEQVDALVAEQQRSRDAAAGNEQQTGALVSQLGARQVQLEAELQAVSAGIAASLRAAGDSGPAPSGFIRSVSAPITSGFGYRTDPFTRAQTFHAGIDFGAACGTPIKAANTGIVFQVTPEAASGGYGNMTIIRHGGGIATLYGHQSSIAVAPGQSVAIGQVIGYVGSTGRSTGCHLHWEVRVNGTPVDPMGYL